MERQTSQTITPDDARIIADIVFALSRMPRNAVYAGVVERMKSVGARDIVARLSGDSYARIWRDVTRLNVQTARQRNAQRYTVIHERSERTDVVGVHDDVLTAARVARLAIRNRDSADETVDIVRSDNVLVRQYVVDGYADVHNDYRGYGLHCYAGNGYDSPVSPVFDDAWLAMIRETGEPLHVWHERQRNDAACNAAELREYERLARLGVEM